MQAVADGRVSRWSAAGDWRDRARLESVGRASDVHDVERRQQAFDRDEAGSWSLSGW
jgi:hypothetical protein